jgi:hypothetical protein
MQHYRDFQPTGFDPKGLALPDQQDWLVVPVSQTRDSGPLDQSNFATAVAMLGGESETVEIHRFGHWGPGWFEIIIVDPKSPQAATAKDIESAMADYPVLDESDFSEREQNEANEVWANCYRVQDRIDYIKKHRGQFEFQTLADMLGCVRGHYFAGYASELLY